MAENIQIKSIYFIFFFYLDTRTTSLGNSKLGNKNPKWAKQHIHG